MQIRTDALYFTDNGAIYCGEHLGSTAKHTGHDISGQKIQEVTPADAKEASAMGLELKCEMAYAHTNPCTRKASLLVAI